MRITSVQVCKMLVLELVIPKKKKKKEKKAAPWCVLEFLSQPLQNRF